MKQEKKKEIQRVEKGHLCLGIQRSLKLSSCSWAISCVSVPS